MRGLRFLSTSLGLAAGLVTCLAAANEPAYSRLYIGEAFASDIPHPGRIVTTYVQVSPPTVPGTVAEVYYQNAPINDSVSDDGTYDMEWNGLDIIIVFDHDAVDGHDEVQVVPPDGLICKPSCTMLVPEGEFDRVHLVENVSS